MDNDQRSTPRADATAEVPWARTTTAPADSGPPHHPAHHGPGPGGPDVPAWPAPTAAPPVWSGRKTAIAAALAIGFASVGAVGAAVVLPASSSPTGTGGRGLPGGGVLPGQQNGQNQQGQPSQQGQPGFPTGQVPGVPGDDDDDHDDHDDEASTT